MTDNLIVFPKKRNIQDGRSKPDLKKNGTVKCDECQGHIFVLVDDLYDDCFMFVCATCDTPQGLVKLVTLNNDGEIA